MQKLAKCLLSPYLLDEASLRDTKTKLTPLEVFRVSLILCVIIYRLSLKQPLALTDILYLVL